MMEKANVQKKNRIKMCLREDGEMMELAGK